MIERLIIGGCLAAALSTSAAMADMVDAKSVVATYSDIALAGYSDALATAKALDEAVDALIASSSPETLSAAKDAWKAARIPYQQTEAFRFGNAIVDDWEGRVVETKKGVVRLLSVSDRAKVLFGAEGASAVADDIENAAFG